MSSLVNECRFRVCDKLSDPESFDSISTEPNYHPIKKRNFDLKVFMGFVQRRPDHDGRFVDVAWQVSSHYISVKEFFKNGSSFLRTNLSHHLLPTENLDFLIPYLIREAQKWHKNHPCRRPSCSKDGFVMIPLVIEIIVELNENVNLEDVVGDTEQEIRMIPTSEEVIRSLEKMELREDEDDADSFKKDACCICLEDFPDNAEVSTMPCHHVFHHNCIVQWLKTSHLCPLCRYSMPVHNNI
ncbi:hypothetical protein QN277_009555 [Acacia crassicarpa]|uniref:RING-type E3 ubiquitin transferase n=1 Tax=Acacia crassicarpa TaxID=499986 RepID=A0AAE1IPK9_9FABA|nr:hypothetical protein QN277_009555 [Acacia crassicarpa]